MTNSILILFFITGIAGQVFCQKKIILSHGADDIITIDSIYFAYISFTVRPEFIISNFKSEVYFHLYNTVTGEDNKYGSLNIKAEYIKLLGVDSLKYAYISCGKAAISRSNSDMGVYEYNIFDGTLTKIDDYYIDDYDDLYVNDVLEPIIKKHPHLKTKSRSDNKIIHKDFQNGKIFRQTTEGRKVTAVYDGNIKPFKGIFGYDGNCYFLSDNDIYVCGKTIEAFKKICSTKMINKRYNRFHYDNDFLMSYADRHGNIYYEFWNIMILEVGMIQTPLFVLSVSPEDGSSIYVEEFSLSIKFNQPLDIAKIDSDFLYLADDFAQHIPLQFALSEDEQTLTLSTDVPLEGENYYLFVQPGLKDKIGRVIETKHKFKYSVQY